MAAWCFNIAKGRVGEFVNRVDSDDPANSAIIIVPLAVGDTEANLQDMDDLATVLASTPNEAGGSWGRKTLTEADFVSGDHAPDDTNNRFAAKLPQITWTGPTTGQDTVALLTCFDSDTTGGGDSSIIPMTYHDFAVTANGGSVTIDAGEFFRAT